jgi:GNAT superfamily N-acetyltransferase
MKDINSLIVSNLADFYALMQTDGSLVVESTSLGRYFRHELYAWPDLLVPDCPLPAGDTLDLHLPEGCQKSGRICFLLLPASRAGSPILREQGWYPVKKWTGMYLDKWPERKHDALGFTIRRIQAGELEEWISLSNRVLYGGKEMLAFPLIEKIFADEAIRIFGGFTEGKMVAGVLIFDSVDSRGVYFTSVLPEYRGKGYGRALMHTALHSLDSSKMPVVLHSTEMGEGLYRKCGFAPVEALIIFARRT